jgi:hypothetical protein
MKKLILAVVALGLVAWPSARIANAQGGGVKDVVIIEHFFNDDPSSTFDSLKALPVVAFADTHVSHAGNFANRHDWAVSADGEDPAIFGMDDYFDFSFDLTLIGTPPGTKFEQRKEAGMIVASSIGGDGQFIVNTDAHEVVSFGGPFPFYKFNDLSYNSGDKINMRVRYFLNADGKRKIQFYANDKTSGPLEFTNLEKGIPGPYYVKGYMQVVIPKDPKIPDNRGVAVFDGITWNGKPIGN